MICHPNLNIPVLPQHNLVAEKRSSLQDVSEPRRRLAHEPHLSALWPHFGLIWLLMGWLVCEAHLGALWLHNRLCLMVGINKFMAQVAEENRQRWN